MRQWVKPAALDEGLRRDGLPGGEGEELNRLRRENRILREARGILSKAAAWCDCAAPAPNRRWSPTSPTSQPGPRGSAPSESVKRSRLRSRIWAGRSNAHPHSPVRSEATITPCTRGFPARSLSLPHFEDSLAEREGFEPSVPVTQYARLAISIERRTRAFGTGLVKTENACATESFSCLAINLSSGPIRRSPARSGQGCPPYAHLGGSAHRRSFAKSDVRRQAYEAVAPWLLMSSIFDDRPEQDKQTAQSSLWTGAPRLLKAGAGP